MRLSLVVLIIGVAGSCRKEELAYLLVNDVKDEGNFFRIHIPSAQRDFIILGKSINGLNLIEIIRKYIRLRPQQTDQQRFFVAYRNGKCVNLPVGVNTIGIFPKRIASFLGLPDADGYAGYRIKKVPNKIGWPATAFTETFNEYF